MAALRRIIAIGAVFGLGVIVGPTISAIAGGHSTSGPLDHMSAATTGASHNFANDKWTRVPGLRTTACTSGLATANVNLAIVHHGWEFRLRVIVDDEVAHPHTATFPGDGAKSFTFVAPDMTPGLHTFAVQTRPIGQGANVEISGGSLILQYAAGAC